MMKRLMTILAFAGLTITALAQETVSTKKYSVATNSFWSNWFVQIGGDYNVWYSNQEHGLGLDNGNHYGLFAKQRRTFGASVAVGKWFSPGFGLRTKLQLGKAKKVGMVGVSKLDYWTLNEHLLFNMSNLLCGYNPDRVWNVTPFIGGGVTRNESISLYAMQLSVGINSSWKLSRLLDLYAEVGWNRMEEDFDGCEGYNQRAKHHGYGWEDKDNNLYAEVGLTFKLGKSGWNKTPDVDALKSMSQSQIDDLNNICSIFCENEFVGIIQKIRIELDNIHIGRFIINPELTGKGLGKRALIEFINLIFQDEDVNSITLNVFDYNVGAKKLYEKVGFKVVNVTENPMKKYMMIMKKGEK